MGDNAFADLIPGAKPVGGRTPTAVQNRRTQIDNTVAGTDNTRVNAQQGRTALAVDAAVIPDDIRKRKADANTAEMQAEITALQLKYPNIPSDQITTAARYNLMQRGNALYEGALKKGYRPDAMGNKVTYMLDKIPGIGTDVANLIRSPEAEEAALGERIFTGGALRSETGAGGPKEERPELRSRYFTTPFMDDTPSVRKTLAELRRQQIETARRASGRLADTDKTLPEGMTPQAARDQAKAAIAAGKPRAAVLQKLKQLGVDTAGL